MENFMQSIRQLQIEVPNEAIHQCHGLPNYHAGLEKRTCNALQQLTSTKVLGIVGMGGIGKTTIAKHLFNKISKDFEYTGFVDSIKGVQKPDHLLRHLYQKGIKVDVTRIEWSDLKGKKLLIILDDVDSQSQLKDLQLPELDYFGIGSKLIITSRNQGIFSAYPKLAYELYDVDFLEVEEAKQLFCFHTFGSEDIPSSHVNKNRLLKEDVNKVVEKCQGLPLTLEVMGGYLRDHNSEPRFWEQAIERLGKAKDISGGRNEQVWTSLRVSYDDLLEEEQEMFIEAGTYFFEQPVEVACATWSTAHEYSDLIWSNLLRRSMVKEVRREVGDCIVVWVHEQLRDLAKSMAEGDVIFGSQREAIGATDFRNVNGVKGDRNLLQLSYVGPAQDRLYIDKDLPRLYGNVMMLKVGLLEKLENVKYLELEDVMCEGSFKNLPRKLSLLRWKGRFFTLQDDLPISLEGMNKLAVLELSAWKISIGFRDTLATLISLRILSLHRLEGLDSLPEGVCKLRWLKRLELRDLTFSTLPESFGKLSSLELLTMETLPIFMLPRSFGELSSLVTLKINCCANFASLPVSFGRLSSLKYLYIINCPLLKCLPRSFGNLSTLSGLELVGCPSLEKLPDNFGHLRALKNLAIYGAKQLEDLSDNFGSLVALTKLSLVHCEILKKLPKTFGLLCALEELELVNCSQLQVLPESFGQLMALNKLTIDGAAHLEDLQDSFGNLTALTKLSLRDCASLQRLPTKFGSMCSLKDLELVNCSQLQRLPECFGQLTALTKLTIEGAAHLEDLCDSFGNLAALTKLSIRDCASLQRLPTKFGLLCALEELELVNCTQLQNLPESFGQLTTLNKVTIRGAKHLEKLSESFGNLAALTELTLEDCECLGRLPTRFGELAALKRLAIRHADQLKALPNSLGRLISLEYLVIECDRVERLPDNFGDLTSLRALKIYCIGLKTLPESLGNLSSLRLLSIISDSLEQLPKSTEWLHSLRHLNLEVKHVSSLPKELGNLLSLKTLRIASCHSLEMLPESLGRASSLRKVILRSCSKLMRVPISLGNPWQGDRDTEVKGLIEGQPSQKIISRQHINLHVSKCRFLDDPLLKTLGWVMTNDIGDQTKEYQRLDHEDLDDEESDIDGDLDGDLDSKSDFPFGVTKSDDQKSLQIEAWMTKKWVMKTWLTKIRKEESDN